MLNVTFVRRAAALTALVATAAIASLSAPSAAQAAGPGTFDFLNGGKGRCDQTLQYTLGVTGPALMVYGLTSRADWVRVFYRLVDLAGNAQSQWIDKGSWFLASSTAPAYVGATQIVRPGSKTYSRMQFFVKYYSNGVYTRWASNTVMLYDLYGFGGPLFGKTYDGVGTACFG